MPVRLATFSDLASISRILAAAFYDEELNSYFFPHRKEHPEDYIQAWYEVVLEKWLHSDNIWLVSYAQTADVAELSRHQSVAIPSNITGAAQWARGGGTSTTSFAIGSYLASMSTLYHSAKRRVIPNRSIGLPTAEDPHPLRKWDFGNAIWPFCQHYFTGPANGREWWQLDLLGVDPTQQGRGFGGELIAWGLNQAEEQNLQAVVMMGEGLEENYKRQGFEVLVGYATTDDITVQEKCEDGNFAAKTLVNPLKQRGIGAGGIAWTKVESGM